MGVTPCSQPVTEANWHPAGERAFTLEFKSVQPSIHLPEVMDLTAAMPLAAEILARRGAPLVLDATSVRRLGTQCLQVLLAAQASWRDDGVGFSFDGSNEEFVAGLERFGAADLLRPTLEETAP